MIRALRKLKGKPVSVADKDGFIIGGGVGSGEHKMVLLFLDLDSSWAAFQWEWSSQVLIIPTSDVICIAADL